MDKPYPIEVNYVYSQLYVLNKNLNYQMSRSYITYNNHFAL